MPKNIVTRWRAASSASSAGVGRDGSSTDGRAHRQREEHRVPDAVGEEQLGHRQAQVVGADAEDLLAVGLAHRADVGVAVHRGLGLAGGARGVEPQRLGLVPRVVRRRGAAQRLAGGEHLGPRARAHLGAEAGRVVAGDDDLADVAAPLARREHRGAGDVGEGRGAQHEPAARVGHEHRELGAAQHRRHRHGHRAEPHRREDAGEQLDLVDHAHARPAARAGRPAPRAPPRRARPRRPARRRSACARAPAPPPGRPHRPPGDDRRGSPWR